MSTAQQNPLITVTELRERLGEVTVLDVRYRLGAALSPSKGAALSPSKGAPGGPGVYAEGHVPGAAYVDLDLDLAAPAGPRGRHPLPEPFRFVNAMRAAGVCNGPPVVVYDDWQGRAAARAWWLLRHYGHPDVRVLDGGWSAWLDAGAPVRAGAQPVPEGDFAGAPGRQRTLEATEITGFAGTLVDAREAPRYRGEEEPIDPVAGHIPGAVNVPTSANLRDDGTFRPAAELRRVYRISPGGPPGPVAAYCGSGVTATHDLLALAIAGVDGLLYPGSWSEWVRDPAHPVAIGEEEPGR